MKVEINGALYVECPTYPASVDGRSMDDALALVAYWGGDGETSLREHFWVLLDVLWAEGEGFSGKRPLGDSGWEFLIIRVLADAGFVDASDRQRASEYVAGLIRHAFGLPVSVAT